MGATTTQGTGLGSADGSTKGPGNGRNSYVPLLSPHIVLAKAITLAASTTVVTFPTPLTGGKANYIVMLTSSGSAATNSGMTNDSNGNFSAFTLAGTSTNVVHYAVITTGQGK